MSQSELSEVDISLLGSTPRPEDEAVTVNKKKKKRRKAGRYNGRRKPSVEKVVVDNIAPLPERSRRSKDDSEDGHDEDDELLASVPVIVDQYSAAEHDDDEFVEEHVLASANDYFDAPIDPSWEDQNGEASSVSNEDPEEDEHEEEDEEEDSERPLIKRTLRKTVVLKYRDTASVVTSPVNGDHKYVSGKALRRNAPDVTGVSARLRGLNSKRADSMESTTSEEVMPVGGRRRQRQRRGEDSEFREEGSEVLHGDQADENMYISSSEAVTSDDFVEQDSADGERRKASNRYSKAHTRRQSGRKRKKMPQRQQQDHSTRNAFENDDDFQPHKSSKRRRIETSEDEEEEDEDEDSLLESAESDPALGIMSELEDLQEDARRARRYTRKTSPAPRRLRERRDPVNYMIPLFPPVVEEIETTPKQRAAAARSLIPLNKNYEAMGMDRFRGIAGMEGKAVGNVMSSDSDDDHAQQKVNRNAGLASGPGMASTSLTGALTSGGTPGMGKVKPRSALADVDPLGVAENIDFSAVGGLDEQINQLKEMVRLPLLYPEIFERFKVVPPRGVLFHGPPGTGKTLLARALAASCSTEARKISFYMRKGADVLSKWVGEAERQLRLLFEEAKSNQPSIIFFDEIDGLAPVRSSKQEQIHASIVATLLALMDGMDNRGQVIVIGATNRPDSVDPALRRPGRFDREFYFPLPDVTARKAIIDIQTKHWDPPLSDSFKYEVALQTKGFGGADLRALCTEAALNAVQRRYPQIYSSAEKLLVDPKTIIVTARDVMKSISKMIPSSERSATSTASVLPLTVKPLLQSLLDRLIKTLEVLLPRPNTTTSLEEAIHESIEDEPDKAFAMEQTKKRFQAGIIFRPRMVIMGNPGMGQHYLAAAVLQHLEKVHLQVFDLATLLSDSARTPEAVLVQLFQEVKAHKPSVIYISGLDIWYHNVSPSNRATFHSLLRSIPSNDPILVLAALETHDQSEASEYLNLIGAKNHTLFKLPISFSSHERREFFQPIIAYLEKSPADLPSHSENRKARKLEVLPFAPPPPPKSWTKEELDALENNDRQLTNQLKFRLSPFLELIRKRYVKFRKPVIDHAIAATFPTQETATQSDPHVRLPDGSILEIATNRKIFNMDIDKIEERLWGGFYLTPGQFIFDLNLVIEDAKITQERDRVIKAGELEANISAWYADNIDENLVSECQKRAERELKRQAALAASNIETEASPTFNQSPAQSNSQLLPITAPPHPTVEVPDSDAVPEFFSSESQNLESGIQNFPANFSNQQDNTLGAESDPPILPEYTAAVSRIENPLRSASSDDDIEEAAHPPLLPATQAMQDDLMLRFLTLSEDFNLEDLEEIYADCMRVLWTTRTIWDRCSVYTQLTARLQLYGPTFK